MDFVNSNYTNNYNTQRLTNEHVFFFIKEGTSILVNKETEDSYNVHNRSRIYSSISDSSTNYVAVINMTKTH